MEIPFLDLTYQHNNISQSIKKAISDVIDSNWFISGKKLEEFEAAYSKFNQVNYTIGVGNGLDALRISLQALNISKGDEVIVPSNTFIATWLAVSSIGATIIPVEPDTGTYNISPSNILSSITSKTRAIIPVHLYGQACQMDEIQQISKDNNLYIIEDNAQSQGATYNDRLTGTFGVLNATSFYPGKNIGAMGDGGAITTNDEELAKKVRLISNYGSSIKYLHELKGINSRLDEIQAAILREKLLYIDKWNKERVEIANAYFTRLADQTNIILPKIHSEATHVFHLFVIQTEKRDALQKYLRSRGIQTLVHYPIPPHIQTAYSDLGFKKGEFPIAEKMASQMLSLPLYPGLSIDEIDYICETINKF